MEHKLTDLQEALLNLLKETLEACEKMNAKVYLSDGTLLGAVRHKGFIPWDDDIDMTAERSEYERILKELPKYLPPHLRLVTYQNTKGYRYNFAKVEDTRTSCIENAYAHIRKDGGIWIDIFPFDGAPNSNFMNELHYRRIRYHLFITAALCHSPKNKDNDMIYRITCWIIQHLGFNLRKHQDKIEEISKKYKVEDCRRIMGYSAGWSDKRGYPKTCILPLSDSDNLNFEDIKLHWTPNDIDGYLKEQYGDYMTPPPVEQRVPTHENVIDLKELGKKTAK